jgi:ElaB/YqjD/DUF883 family membrane-anchored ribosome-binding protein
MSEMTTAQKDKLMTDLNLVVADAEELLKLTAGEAGDKAAEMRRRMQVRMEQAKSELAHLQDAAVARAKDASRAADAYVHDSPWTAIGMAAGVGVVLGMLIARR